MSDPAFDRRLLDLAARVAMRSVGNVEPNPLVGAVVVRWMGSTPEVIGIGHHRRFGEAHAERAALSDCMRRGHDPRGATVYATLEPCNHTGKQPPCALGLIEAGVAEVVAARRDPNPLAAGGFEALEKAGIRCRVSGDSRAAIALSDPFVKRVKTGLPWVIAKWAQTIDGRVATRNGESKWISGDRSRKRVHRLRARVDAVLTGMGTVLADDPMLTARDVRRVRRAAMRVVADTDLDMPETAKLVTTARDLRTIVACSAELATGEITRAKRQRLATAGAVVVGVPTIGERLDLAALLRLLASEHGVSSVLVESGPGLLGSMLDADLVDELVVYVAPMMLGDEMARAAAAGRIAPTLSMAQRYELLRAKRIENDLEVVYRRRA
jgi:diaminohydroxyphosphoribosylaminopyrimidine deaminase/5-amino-6-(5-phosphoribosylamino)uracil reductase